MLLLLPPSNKKSSEQPQSKKSIMPLLVPDPLFIYMLDVEVLEALVSGQRCFGNDIDFGCEKTSWVGFFYTAMQYCNTADTYTHGSC